MKDLKYRTEKHVDENLLKYFENDNEQYKKKHKSLNKKKILKITTENLVGLKSATSTSKTPLINPSIGIVLTSPTALLTSIAILTTNENVSKLKIRFTKKRDWINVNTML